MLATCDWENEADPIIVDIEYAGAVLQQNRKKIKIIKSRPSYQIQAAINNNLLSNRLLVQCDIPYLECPTLLIINNINQDSFRLL